MAGTNIRIEVDAKRASQAVSGAAEALQDPKPMLRDIYEELIRIHRQRFNNQKAPDGKPWQALSPRYKKSKKKNQNKILTRDSDLQGSLRGLIDDDGLLFGTNIVYGAIHQFGGQIKRKARTASVFFKQRRDGSVGNRFVKKSKSDFAQDVNIGAHTVTMPARPWLGTSVQDDANITKIALRYLENSLE